MHTKTYRSYVAAAHGHRSMTATTIAWPGISFVYIETLYYQRNRQLMIIIFQRSQSLNMHRIRNQKEEDTNGNGIQSQHKRTRPHRYFLLLVSFESLVVVFEVKGEDLILIYIYKQGRRFVL
ncbi:hypothetical protein ACOSQ2_005411 [Xanthoceras sorbifolium]